MLSTIDKSLGASDGTLGGAGILKFKSRCSKYISFHGKYFNFGFFDLYCVNVSGTTFTAPRTKIDVL